METLRNGLWIVERWFHRLKQNFANLLKKLPLGVGGRSKDKNHQMSLKLGDFGTLNKG